MFITEGECDPESTAHDLSVCVINQRLGSKECSPYIRLRLNGFSNKAITTRAMWGETHTYTTKEDYHNKYKGCMCVGLDVHKLMFVSKVWDLNAECVIIGG